MDGATVYKINRTLIKPDPTGPIREIIQETLIDYEAGKDLANCSIVRWGRDSIRRGAYFYKATGMSGAEAEQAIQERLKMVIALYEDMKANGYNDSPISIYFDKATGEAILYDGYHRLAILDQLEQSPDLNCTVSTWDPDPDKKGDFPLREKLLEINGGLNVYNPVDDERVKDFNIWRRDSATRLSWILPHLIGYTVLDAGCAEGYFSRELAKRKYEVTANDIDPRRLAVNKYLATIANLPMTSSPGDWIETLKAHPFQKYDNVLLLSVIHHKLLNEGPEALQSLEILRGRTKRLFAEIPPKASDVSWTEKKGAYAFREVELIEELEKITGLKMMKVYRGIRPLIVLEAQL